MPVLRQPPSLVSLSRREVQLLIKMTILAEASRSRPPSIAWMMSEWRDSNRLLWGGGALPATLRQQLLLECSASLDVFARVEPGACTAQCDLHALLLAAMLDRDVAELRVRLCCAGECEHKELTMDVIRWCTGPGLTTLELAQPSPMSTTTDMLFLTSVLDSTINLTTLVLRGIATDHILRVISKFCFKLTVLDVCQSPGVTDTGVCNLMYFPHKVPLKWPEYSPMALLSEINFDYSNESNLIKAIEEVGWPMAAEQKEPPSYTPSPLCESLRVLDLTDTGVTRIGKVIALLSARHLWSLGERCHVGRALDLLSKCAVPLGDDGLRLSVAITCRATAPKLQAVAATCPRLRCLTVPGPLFLPAELDAAMPDTLTQLDLRRVPASRAWLDGLFAYLRGPRSRGLRQLSLGFRSASVGRRGGDGGREDDDGDNDDEAPVTVDLGEFLFDVPELDLLVLNGIGATFGPDSGGGGGSVGLTRLRLGKVEGPDALARLVRRAPGLELVRVDECPGMDGRALVATFSGAARLRCIHVGHVTEVDVSTVQRLVAECPAIVHVADVYNWDISVWEISRLRSWMQRNNLGLMLYGDFWLSCHCFED